MAEMERITIAIPDGVLDELYALRAKPEYTRCSLSEIVRTMVLNGLKSEMDEADKSA